MADDEQMELTIKGSAVRTQRELGRSPYVLVEMVEDPHAEDGYRLRTEIGGVPRTAEWCRIFGAILGDVGEGLSVVPDDAVKDAPDEVPPAQPQRYGSLDDLQRDLDRD